MNEQQLTFTTSDGTELFYRYRPDSIRLHERFADNDLIQHSLDGFGDAIESGGYLIYTGQPWHPQLEMIARALTSHKAGSPDWVMRRRSQQEMDQLVARAGFHKIHQWIDEYGIFTVSLARKK